MEWTNDLRIETPEQIDVSLELSGLGSRFVARLHDWLYKWGILLLAAALVAIVLALLGTQFQDKTVQAFLLALLAGLFYAFLLGYDIYFEVRHNGQTPGKRQAGIRVIQEGGAPLDFRSSCIRNLLGVADFLPCFYLLGGFLVMLTKRNQRFGDLAAGTVVVRERAVQAPVDLSKEIEHFASPEFTFTGDQLAGCSADERQILRSFFLRYRDLEQHSRQRLARRLAEEFLRKTCYPLKEHFADERAITFLASVYRDMEKLARHGR